MTRKSFSELGVADEAVVGYVAAVMTEFARADRLFAMRSDGRAVDSVVRMRLAGGAPPRDERGLVRARPRRCPG